MNATITEIIEGRQVSRATRRRRAGMLKARIDVNLRELLCARLRCWKFETALAIGGIGASRKAAKQRAVLLEWRERAESLATARQSLIAELRIYEPGFEAEREAFNTLSRLGLAGLVRLEPEPSEQESRESAGAEAQCLSA